jgi:hypothetical protein
MSERTIGRVISVDSFRVFIRLDDELKSLYKSGYEDIYEVARINSYIIIPIGADRIVAMVTSVRAIDETELGNKEAIFLTKSARYLVATMIGTLENNGHYVQGVYNYPILDNPIWYVTRQDLDCIFDQKEKKLINFDEDYYLPIGTSPSFVDYKIKINPDKFFGKHAAILGNTGSGKSCTLASIIQSLFDFEYNEKKLKNAHVIIFDTNGEYKNAFQGSKEVPYKNLKEVNPFYIDKNGLKVPFWFMNFADFEYLFDPSANTQTPILKRAISIAKENKESDLSGIIPRPFIFFLQELLAECQKPDFKVKNRIFKDLKDYCIEFNKIATDYDTKRFKEILKEIYSEKSNFKQEGKYVEGFLNPTNFSKYATALSAELTAYNIFVTSKITSEERNIDLPLWFGFEKLINQYIDNAIDELEGTNNRIREFVSTLRLRLQSFLNDERIATPLLFNQTVEIEQVLAKFISFVLGDFCKIYQEADKDLYTEYYKKQLSKTDNEKIEPSNPNQITIIDMSLLPYEVLETITGLIGRIILEFLSRYSDDKDRGKTPVVIVLEEAQNYIPEKNNSEKQSIAKNIFERIAREGRKYGISLLVSSQRPSELSKTVLSQCNSFIIHRLQNPEDQKYVKQLVSAANEDILQQLPILPQQHVIVMGDAVRMPVQARMNNADPRPNSNNPRFIENWLKTLPRDFPNYREVADAWENGEKFDSNVNSDDITGSQTKLPVKLMHQPFVYLKKYSKGLLGISLFVSEN